METHLWDGLLAMWPFLLALLVALVAIGFAFYYLDK
jgi:hypothetical protein